MKKITVKDAYLALSKASGIKVGDTVKVLRKAKDDEMGWSNSWTIDMDGSIGKTFTVKRDDDYAGFRLDNSGWGQSFPFFVLEKVVPPVPRSKSFYVEGALVKMEYDDCNEFDDKNVTIDFEIPPSLTQSGVERILAEMVKFRQQHVDAEKI